MDDVLFKKNTFDRSPLSFAKMAFLKTKVFENVDRYKQIRYAQTGRLDSNHLLISIISNLATLFDGDLFSYMTKIENVSRRLVGAMGLVTHYNKGTLFDEGVFYPGCREVITCADGPFDVMDLWNNWRKVSAITVQQHPVTDARIFELAVKNEAVLSNPGLVVINIDLPILAAQYQMFKASGENSLERFITQVVIPGMMESHMDLVFVNKVLLELGVIKPCTVKSNVTFMQVDLNGPADALADDVVKGLLTRDVDSRKILATIPLFYKDNYLDLLSEIKLIPTQQAMWAKEASRFSAAALCLEIAKRAGYGKQLELVTKVTRNAIQADTEGWYRNGLVRDEAVYMTALFQQMVLSRLPA